MITLALLNVFLVAAALAVVKVTPDRSLALQPPTVAARMIMPPGSPALAPLATTAPLPASGPLAARLAGPMRASDLGTDLTGAVIDAATGRKLFGSHADQPAVPASTTKLTTATAVLASAGPDHRITTKVVRSGNTVTIVGGGDPTLTTSASKSAYPRPASLTDLAKQTAAALKAAGVRKVTVDYDTSAYQGSRSGPNWKPVYFAEGDVAPVSALELDAGRMAPGAQDRVADPPALVASAFSLLLDKRGVTADVGTRTTAPRGAQRIGAVQSPPISALVERMLTDSDNDIAEAMSRQVAMKLGRPPTFEGGGDAVHQVLASLGLAAGIDTVDGSGLSPLNRITPNALARLLAFDGSSAEHPELRTVMSGMPIAGFSGTLSDRYSGTAADGKGVIRAKTGTLNGVNTLAGTVVDADGRLLTFAFMANRVRSPTATLAALDSLAAILAGCGCR
ncbi:MAG TPA: D-alanyl-D-alanine carboxypeptidase/D-alanyl-D-alanine-endopeptidase [Actinoallomurus sp.]|jgi:D-alanyl-D-alanine carboxypeptidase/D-alanyl-D-alanine-endopeptidase (penicillin-binding protein 4)